MLNKILRVIIWIVLLWNFGLMSVTLFHAPIDYSKATFCLLMIGMSAYNLKTLDRSEMVNELLKKMAQERGE